MSEVRRALGELPAERRRALDLRDYLDSRYPAGSAARDLLAKIDAIREGRDVAAESVEPTHGSADAAGYIDSEAPLGSPKTPESAVAAPAAARETPTSSGAHSRPAGQRAETAGDHSASPSAELGGLPNVNGTEWTPLTVFTDPRTGRPTFVDHNGIPHVTATSGDNPRCDEALPFIERQALRDGSAYDPATGNGSVYHFQDDNAALVRKSVVNDVSGGRTVAGTTSDLIRVTYRDGVIVRVESYDVTGTDREPFVLGHQVNTINNKMDLRLKRQTENVIFVVDNDAEGHLLAEHFAGNRHVRIINPRSGFDSAQ